MTDSPKSWSWSDGWILMAIFLARKEENPTLAYVIATADAINHAIPTPTELSPAFTRLTNAGILRIENDQYRIEEKYLAEIEKAYRGRGGLFESANKGEKWLNRLKQEIKLTPKITVTEEDAEKAYNIYISKIVQKR